MSTENAFQDPLADVLEDAFLVGRFDEDPVDRGVDWQRAAWCARQFLAAEKPAPSSDVYGVQDMAMVLLGARTRYGDNWEQIAAAAIAHCGQEATRRSESVDVLIRRCSELTEQSNRHMQGEAKERQRADELEIARNYSSKLLKERHEQIVRMGKDADGLRQRADAKLREWGMACAEAVDLRAEVKQFKDKLAEKTECFYAADGRYGVGRQRPVRAEPRKAAQPTRARGAAGGGRWATRKRIAACV
jgi:hypothetical protein